MVDSDSFGIAVDAEYSPRVSQVGHVAHLPRSFLPHEGHAAGASRIACSYQLELLVGLAAHPRDDCLDVIALFLIQLLVEDLR